MHGYGKKHKKKFKLETRWKERIIRDENSLISWNYEPYLQFGPNYKMCLIIKNLTTRPPSVAETCYKRRE